MILFLVLCSLLIPVNVWAAITPHLHSDVSMRILHGVSTLVLLPLLWDLWQQRRQLATLPSLFLTIFSVVLIVVNIWIAIEGMETPPINGKLDHLFLSLSEAVLIAYFLLAPEPSTS